MRPGMMLYFERINRATERLDDSQFGALMKALIRFAQDGQEPDISNFAVQIVFDMMRDEVAADAQRYESVVEKRRRAGIASGKSRQANARSAEHNEHMLTGVQSVQQNEPITTTIPTTTTTTTTIPTTKTTKEANASCAERRSQRHSTPEPQPTPSEFNLLLNDGTDYNVPQENIEKYRTLYPGVDIEQELRNMMGWCFGNPKQRKTRGGIKRFIAGWLGREQNKSRRDRPVYGKPNPALAYTQRSYTADEANDVFTDLSDIERQLGMK